MNISEFFYACIRGDLTVVKQAIASFRVWLVRKKVTYSQFLDACNKGDLAVVKQGLASPELREILSNNIETLVMAAQNGHLAVVNRLLEIDSVRKNAAVFNNQSLVMAAENGHLAVVNRLLEINSVRANAAANDNYALRLAAQNGHLAVVNRLLEIDSVRENAVARYNLALRCAAQNGHLAVVNRLLEIDSVRANAAALGNEALQLAAKNGHLAVVNRLLEIDSVRENPVARYNDVLGCAVSNKHYDVAARLLKEPVFLKCMQLNQPNYIKENQAFFEKFKENSQVRVVLPRFLSGPQANLTRDIVNKILTYAFHDIISGKSLCHKTYKVQQLTVEKTCPIITQFRHRCIYGDSDIGSNHEIESQVAKLKITQ